MKTDECPLGDKIKLKFVLKGNEKVCLGYHEIQELGLIEIHEACKGCKFHNDSYAITPNGFDPWAVNPATWPTTSPTTSTAAQPYTTTGNPYAYGTWADNTWADNTSYISTYSMTPEEFEKFKKGEI